VIANQFSDTKKADKASMKSKKKVSKRASIGTPSGEEMTHEKHAHTESKKASD